jgi:DNA-directed RNA polymerase subunit RPC12/RpoP
MAARVSAAGKRKGDDTMTRIVSFATDDDEMIVCDGCRFRIHESEAQRWGGEILCQYCREKYLSPKPRKALADR